MTIQEKINKLTEAMERAKDPDFREIWRRKIGHLHRKEEIR
mgnify:CR=1 FL=1